MDIQRIRALRGPNLWSHHTAIEAVVQCTPAECELSPRQNFGMRLRARFPQILPLNPTGHDETVSLA
ncbi:MAG: hypothetical protein N3C59_10985, partial [Azovibrio sp.]|nr:hypothetical protein [Azovibrio sp.]